MISRLLGWLFPYELPTKLGTMLVAQNMIAIKPTKDAFVPMPRYHKKPKKINWTIGAIIISNFLWVFLVLAGMIYWPTSGVLRDSNPQVVIVHDLSVADFLNYAERKHLPPP